MTAPDELVWVAAVRRGITWHRIDGHGVGTLCGRSMRHGQSISRMRATHELAGEACPRCTAAESAEGFGPADGSAPAGGSFPPGADPAPSPAATGEGVTPETGCVHMRVSEVTVSAVPEGNVNHALFSVKVSWRGGETYAVERHRECLGADGEWDYEPLPSGRTDEWIATHRFGCDEALRLAHEACQHITVNGHSVADVLAASAPDGTAVASPAAVPPQTPARAAVTTSDSGCPGGHHTLRETT